MIYFTTFVIDIYKVADKPEYPGIQSVVSSVTEVYIHVSL